MAKITAREIALFIVNRLDELSEVSLEKVVGAFWVGMRIQETDPDLAKRVRDVIYTHPEFKGMLVGRLDQWLASLRDISDLSDEDASDDL